MKLGAVVGFNGEALRSVDLKMSRRAGEIRSFGLNAKIGRDATLTGDLRGRSSGRQVVYLESGDAGAFFRFTDVYSRMTGGQMAIAMEAPSADNAAQHGTLNVRNFAVHDETQLERACRPTARTAQPQRHRFLQHARRLHPHARARRVARRRRARTDRSAAPSTAWSITAATTCTCAARWCRSTDPTICSDRCRWSGCSLAARRKGLLGITYEVVGRPGNPRAAHQSDFGAGAGTVAQGVRISRQRRHRRHRVSPSSLAASSPSEFAKRSFAKPA